uniref:Ubiquitin-like protease family profile domain-containing protein n=1 Tax=Brassica oleracea var. oleracea TaxID=109376 RepID=A0A0D3D9T4_BRAOL
MKPPKFEKGKTVDSPVDMLVLKLKQETFRLTGFPLALQLLAFRAIPMLLYAVLQVEVNPSLRVTPLIPVIRGPHPGWGLCGPEEIAEPVFTFTPIPENPVHKKHTVPRKRKESMLKPHKAGKETSVPTDQRRSTRLITGLEATVAKLGASNERLKQKLHRKRKRSRATSLLPQFVVTHRRRSAPQAPQTNDLPGDDHHDSPNSNRRKTKQVSDGILGSGSPILSQYCAQYCASRRIDFNNPFFTDHLLVDHPSADHTSSPHQYPGPHSPLSHSHNQRSTPLLATDHNSSDHISPNHQTHNHPSPTSGYANHNSPNHDPQSCEAPQGSLSQQYAPIGTLPQFDAIPLNKPSSQSSPSHGHTLPEPDTAPPVYDSSALLYSPIPLFNPTPAATTPPTISPNPLFTPPPGLTTTPTSSPNKLTGFSTHYSTPNAFAATASLKGSTSRLIYQDPTNKHGVGEASDSSPDKTVRRVVDELNAQTSVLEVCELMVTPPPEDLWDIFAKTMATNKKSLPRHTFKTRLQQPVSPPARYSLPVDRLSDMHHKDVLQMENATFMPPTLTSLMQCKDHQFQATVKKDKIRWDHRISKLILLSGKIWMKEVQKVYTPMIWVDRHWVGLAIDLRARHVDVLDSLPSLYDEEDVQRFLRPNLQMLPYLIRYLVKNNSRDLSPFTCQRRTGTY